MVGLESHNKRKAATIFVYNKRTCDLIFLNDPSRYTGEAGEVVSYPAQLTVFDQRLGGDGVISSYFIILN